MQTVTRRNLILGPLLVLGTVLGKPVPAFPAEIEGSPDHAVYPPKNLPGVVVGIGTLTGVSIHRIAGERFPYTRLELELARSDGLGEGERNIELVSLDAAWCENGKVSCTSGTTQFSHTLKLGGTYLFVAAYHRDESALTFPTAWVNSRFLYFARYLPAGPEDVGQEALRILSGAPSLEAVREIEAGEISEKELTAKLYESMQLTTEPTNQTAAMIWDDLTRYYGDSMDQSGGSSSAATSGTARSSTQQESNWLDPALRTMLPPDDDWATRRQWIGIIGTVRDFEAPVEIFTGQGHSAMVRFDTEQVFLGAEYLANGSAEVGTRHALYFVPGSGVASSSDSYGSERYSYLKTGQRVLVLAQRPIDSKCARCGRLPSAPWVFELTYSLLLPPGEISTTSPTLIDEVLIEWQLADELEDKSPASLSEHVVKQKLHAAEFTTIELIDQILEYLPKD